MSHTINYLDTGQVVETVGPTARGLYANPQEFLYDKGKR